MIVLDRRCILIIMPYCIMYLTSASFSRVTGFRRVGFSALASPAAGGPRWLMLMEVKVVSEVSG